MPITGLDLSSGARAGLTSFLAGVLRQVVALDGATPVVVATGEAGTRA